MGGNGLQIRVMVVEDAPDIRNVLKSALETRWEVVVASNGREALEILDRAEPDIMVLDVMMPRMDGFELARQIRRNRSHHSTPFVFLTSLTSKNDAMQGYDLGATAYLTKPVNIDRLLKNIEIILTERNIVPSPKRYPAEQIHAPAPQRASGTLAPQRTTLPKSDPGQPRVLIVEEDDAVLRTLSGALIRDYEVFIAHDGREALDRIERLEPDLITIDFPMPRMSGLQFIQIVRALPAMSSTPVLMITGQASERNVRRARESGANAVIPKPIDTDQLRQTLAALMREPGFTVRWPKTHRALAFPPSWRT